LAAAVTAHLHASGLADAYDPEYGAAVADFITDIAADFPIGTPLCAVYDHRGDEWNFVVDPRPELRRRACEQPLKFTIRPDTPPPPTLTDD